MKSHNLLLTTLLSSVVGAGVACSRDGGGAQGSSGAPLPAASPGYAGIELGHGGAQYQDEDLPVSPDFEAEADRAITKENYLEELDAIEGELNASLPDAGRSSRPSPDAGPDGPDAGARGPDAGRRRPRPLPEPL